MQDEVVTRLSKERQKHPIPQRLAYLLLAAPKIGPLRLNNLNRRIVGGVSRYVLGFGVGGSKSGQGRIFIYG